MSKYMIVRSHHVEHSDGELMHWKYIKREKKNGKWIYFYRDSKYEKAKRNYETTKQDSARAASKRNALIGINEKKIDAINSAHNAKYGDKAGDSAHWHEAYVKLHPYIAENNQAKKAAKEAAQRASKAESSYKRAKRVYDESAGHKVADLLNKTSNAANKAISNAKSFIKDKLGYDEKALVESTKRKYDNAKLWEKGARDYRSNMDGHTVSSVPKATLDRMLDAFPSAWDKAKRQERDARDAYNRAKSKYDKTPLGIAENIAKKSKSLSNDIGDGVEDFIYNSRKNIEKGVERVKDAANDVALEVDYQAKKAWGTHAKENYETKQKLNREAERDLDNARSMYKTHPNGGTKFKYEQAANRAKNSRETLDKAKDRYARTPAGVIDIGDEYLKTWFERISKQKKSR
jgi:hypothetical protein